MAERISISNTLWRTFGKHSVKEIEQAFADHPEIESGELDVIGAVYDIETGRVEWLNER